MKLSLVCACFSIANNIHKGTKRYLLVHSQFYLGLSGYYSQGVGNAGACCVLLLNYTSRVVASLDRKRALIDGTIGLDSL